MKNNNWTKEEVYNFVEKIAEELNVSNKFKDNLSGKGSIKSKLNKIDISFKPKPFDLFNPDSLKKLKEKKEIVNSEEAEVEIVN
ncbi:hypothetical protein TUBRATIS_008260 [Tubulinosema ratisbonensis]|uniref:Uncharacterized protein n=1 Tax=Tubulinosema ratisbonensis TaxID=291195 RepID=A0A437AN70_9MICR|nr:hypothetical protein TUBRATIS_008260 [Tubulinosema ratisbonensis]